MVRRFLYNLSSSFTCPALIFLNFTVVSKFGFLDVSICSTVKYPLNFSCERNVTFYYEKDHFFCTPYLFISNLFFVDNLKITPANIIILLYNSHQK